jgi:maintenance of morphology protein 1
MGANYIFSLQPTFTQGLVLGQLSVLVLLVLILKYLFLDSTQNPFETSSYQPRLDRNVPPKTTPVAAQSDESKVQDNDTESAEWFNTLLRQVNSNQTSTVASFIDCFSGSRCISL